MKIKNIIIGSDHGGFLLKEKLKKYLTTKKMKVKDAGTYSLLSCDYPLIAYKVAEEVSCGKHKRGILICKTGIGQSIAANKLRKVRAALCYNVEAAKLSRMHNDSNILVLGARFTPFNKAKAIIDAWLKSDFEGGRHSRRIKEIRNIEERKL